MPHYTDNTAFGEEKNNLKTETVNRPLILY